MRHDALAIVQAGIRACEPAGLTRAALDAAPCPYCRCVAAGKAAVAMARGAASALGGRIRAGLIVAPHAESFGVFEGIAGGHPIPDAGSEHGGRRALEIAGMLAADEELLVLLSGGASALMAVPAEGLTLDDKQKTTAQLLRAGADIHALNTVRKHLSAIKGGRLAERARGRVRTLVISDVVGDDLSVIASGPTVGDASTFADARALINRYGGASAYPAAVVAHLDRGVRGERDETPKPGDARIASASTRIIGSRRDAMRGAAEQAAVLGYHVVRIEAAVVGEARVAARSYARAVAARTTAVARPVCVVSAGETTVRVTGRGAGGRNQEFALALGTEWGRSRDGVDSVPTPSPVGTKDDERSTSSAFVSVGDGVDSVPGPSPFLVASVGTDGIDGPTDVAGALADSTTLARAKAAGLDPDACLSDNNAYAFFETLGDLIRTGPTGTNVGDLQIVLISRQE